MQRTWWHRQSSIVITRSLDNMANVLLVSYGYNHGEPIRAVDADAYVDSLDELQLV